MNRRVRLTVRLGGGLTDVGTGQQENADADDMMRFYLASAQASRVNHKLLPGGPRCQIAGTIAQAEKR